MLRKRITPGIMVVLMLSAGTAGAHTRIRLLFHTARWAPSITTTVDVLRAEHIEAPADHPAWTGSYGWLSHYSISVTPRQVEASLSLYSSQPASVREMWSRAALQKWNGRLRLVGGATSRAFVLRIRWVSHPFMADYVITSHAPGATNGGQGTDSMINWGVADSYDVPHEVGHMLGAYDAYFTVNGVPFGPANSPQGEVMNNPAGLPAPRDLSLVARTASAIVGYPLPVFMQNSVRLPRACGC